MLLTMTKNICFRIALENPVYGDSPYTLQVKCWLKCKRFIILKIKSQNSKGMFIAYSRTSFDKYDRNNNLWTGSYLSLPSKTVAASDNK
jgi:hypothetical protein